MRITCLMLMTAVACPALAQSDTTFMPEGSKDIHLSATAALVQRAEGSSKMRLVVLPSASVQWSNGVFLEPGALGMQMSSDGNLRYGPVLDYGVKRQRSDEPDRGTRLDLQAGGFASYQPLHDLRLHGKLLYGGSDDHRGAQLSLGATWSMPIAQHQGISLSAGAAFVDRAYMQSYFGINAEQARRTRRAIYNAGGGLKNVGVSAGWNIELTHKYSLSSGVSMRWLGDIPAASPLSDSNSGYAVHTSLTYHY
jgi:outer membrane protein